MKVYMEGDARFTAMVEHYESEEHPYVVDRVINAPVPLAELVEFIDEAKRNYSGATLSVFSYTYNHVNGNVGKNERFMGSFEL